MTIPAKSTGGFGFPVPVDPAVEHNLREILRRVREAGLIGDDGEPFVEREFVISTDPVDPQWEPERVGSLWLQVIEE